MRDFKNAALGLLGLAAVAAASDVHDLKQDTFEPFVKEHDLVLAECEWLIYPTAVLNVVRSLTRIFKRSLRGTFLKQIKFGELVD